MELGSVAELTSAVATTGALIAAALAAKAALATNRQQSAQLRRMEEEQAERRAAVEQESSSKVAIWQRVDAENRPVLRYVNLAALPVYAVDIWIATPTEVFRLTYPVIGPSESTKTLSLGTTALREQAAASPFAYDWRRREFACTTIFRDTAGRWWRRDLAGMLVRHQDETGARAAVDADVRERFPSAVEARLTI